MKGVGWEGAAGWGHKPPAPAQAARGWADRKWGGRGSGAADKAIATGQVWGPAKMGKGQRGAWPGTSTAKAQLRQASPKSSS